ncbi:hypothetical protein BGZ73_002012 [Actinomortierella ambigua]|nr:hypothetical protein BGZ73_002012 [Actinomortierella ambigua]
METLGNAHVATSKLSVLDIPETLQLVCSFLDRRTLLAASRVSKAWRACCHPFLWSTVPATAWTSPYFVAHWKQHAPLIRHLSLGQPSEDSPSFLCEASKHCQDLVSVDASRMTVSVRGNSSGGGSGSGSGRPIHCDLNKLLLHNYGQLRSLQLSLQGRIPRDLVYALGNLRVLRDLVLDHWTDFDEYSLELVLLEACPHSLESLSLSDNDFSSFTLESLHTAVLDCPATMTTPTPVLAGAGRSSATALTATTWTGARKEHQKRASDSNSPTASPTIPTNRNTTTATNDVSTRARFPSWSERDQDQQQSELCQYPQPNNCDRRHLPLDTNKEMEMNNKVYPHLGSKFNLPLPLPCHPGTGAVIQGLSRGTVPTKPAAVETNTQTTTNRATTTQIRSLNLHRATFRQGFLLNLVRLCPKLERLSLLESSGFFPTPTFPSRLARLCPHLRAFEFSSPAERLGGGQRQSDLSDTFFVDLLQQFPQTSHLVVGASRASSNDEDERRHDGWVASSLDNMSASSVCVTGAPTGFSLKAWKQLLQTFQSTPPLSHHHHHHQHQHQLVHLTLDGIRGLPSKQLVQVLAQCSSLEHWSAKGVVLNARDVEDPKQQPWACRRLKVFVMDIEIYETNIGAPVAAAAAAAVGPVPDHPPREQHGQEPHQQQEQESVEAVVRRRMYGQLALLGCLVHVGIGGGHSLRRRRRRRRQVCSNSMWCYSGRTSQLNDNLLKVADGEEEIEEEEPGIDLTRRSGVELLHGPKWPFLEVLDVTRLGTNPRWRLDEGDEAWLASQFPRLRRILVPKKKVSHGPPPPSLFSAYTLRPYSVSQPPPQTLWQQQQQQPTLEPPSEKPDYILPWIRHHRSDIIIDEQS